MRGQQTRPLSYYFQAQIFLLCCRLTLEYSIPPHVNWGGLLSEPEQISQQSLL